MTSSFLLFFAALAVLAAWLPGRWRPGVAAVSVGLLVGGGLQAGVLAPEALVAVAALFGSAWWAANARRWRALGWGAFGILALGIGFGLVPGFSAVVLAEPAVLKPGSQPYGLRLGMGKLLVAVALLQWLVPVARTAAQWRALLRGALPVMAATALAVPLLAWAAGQVRPAPGLPSPALTLGWMAVNLLVVCTAEEGFFRGLVQRGLARVLPVPLAIALAALLFGLAHFAGGWTAVLVATAAGLGYGLAYQWGGQRIEAAILAHFGLNLTHFALFTYPAAA